MPNFEDAIKDVDTSEKNIPKITNGKIRRKQLYLSFHQS